MIFLCIYGTESSFCCFCASYLLLFIYVECFTVDFLMFSHVLYSEWWRFDEWMLLNDAGEAWVGELLALLQVLRQVPLDVRCCLGMWCLKSPSISLTLPPISPVSRRKSWNRSNTPPNFSRNPTKLIEFSFLAMKFEGTLRRMWGSVWLSQFHETWYRHVPFLCKLLHVFPHFFSLITLKTRKQIKSKSHARWLVSHTPFSFLNSTAPIIQLKAFS
jgi:hypothetical protein